MRRLRASAGALLAAGVALVAVGAGTADAAGVRQSGVNVFTTTKPGAASGARFHVNFTNPENPGQKPHTVNRIVIRYPAGTLYDFTVVPQCHASDAQLQVQGSSACPAASKIGAGLAVSDTGSPGPFPPRYTNSTISQFNGDHELIGVGENQDIPAIKTVTRTKFNGTTASTNFPTFPGLPPPDQYTPLKSLNVDFAKKVVNGRATIRTPRTCPAVGFWRIVSEFTYVDGVTQKLVSRSPCKAANPTPKPPKGHKPPCKDDDDSGDREDSDSGGDGPSCR